MCFLLNALKKHPRVKLDHSPISGKQKKTKKIVEAPPVKLKPFQLSSFLWDKYEGTTHFGRCKPIINLSTTKVLTIVVHKEFHFCCTHFWSNQIHKEIHRIRMPWLFLSEKKKRFIKSQTQNKLEKTSYDTIQTIHLWYHDKLLFRPQLHWHIKANLLQISNDILKKTELDIDIKKWRLFPWATFLEIPWGF